MVRDQHEPVTTSIQTSGPYSPLAESAWIEGTLVDTSRKCGKKTCTCHNNGPRHPVLFVTWKEEGKTVSLYIPRQLEPTVREWAQNYKKLKALIRQISDIQKQIIRLRD